MNTKISYLYRDADNYKRHYRYIDCRTDPYYQGLLRHGRIFHSQTSGTAGTPLRPI